MEGECVVVRGGAVATGTTGLDYGLGITAETARALCESAGVDPGRRAETLTIEEFSRLAQTHG